MAEKVGMRCPNCEEHQVELNVPGFTRLECDEPTGLRVTPFEFHAWMVEIFDEEECQCECGQTHHTVSSGEEHPVFGKARPNKRRLLAEIKHEFGGGSRRVGRMRRPCEGDHARWMKDGTGAANFWLLKKDTWFLLRDYEGKVWNTFEPTTEDTIRMLKGTLTCWTMDFDSPEAEP